MFWIWAPRVCEHPRSLPAGRLSWCAGIPAKAGWHEGPTGRVQRPGGAVDDDSAETAPHRNAGSGGTITAPRGCWTAIAELPTRAEEKHLGANRRLLSI